MRTGFVDRSPLPEAAVRTLLGPESATAALGRWFCDAGTAVTAQVFAGETAPLPASLSPWLAEAEDEPFGYRHVQLVGGATVFSEAEIWYRAAALDGHMQRLLSETDMPFGAVVAPLRPRRLAIAVRAAPLCIDALLLVDGATLAVARERYHEPAMLAGWQARQEGAVRAA